MPDSKNLPFLLALLDDDSTVVRTHVRAALQEFGSELETGVQPFLNEMDIDRLDLLEEILDELRDDEFEANWMEWLNIVNPKQSLEYALIQLAYMEYGSEAYLLGDELDELSERFLEHSPDGTVENLMEFLFQHERFRSPLEGSESHLHDNLIYVLKTRRGSQIALSCLAILVGWRIGIDLEGVSIQGNFMAMCYQNHRMQMYNSFNKGKPLARASVMYIEEAFRRNQIGPQEMKAEVYEIILQILNRTIRVFHKRGRNDQASDYEDLMTTLDNELRERGLRND